MGIYGGLAIVDSERLILRTMKKGARKKTNNHRKGMITITDFQ